LAPPWMTGSDHPRFGGGAIPVILLLFSMAPRYIATAEMGCIKVRARPGRLGALSVSHSKSVLYGAFVWARGALNRRKPAVSGPSCRRLFGPLFTYYCKRLLVPVLPYYVDVPGPGPRRCSRR
jgi:hypothetical protein